MPPRTIISSEMTYKSCLENRTPQISPGLSSSTSARIAVDSYSTCETPTLLNATVPVFRSVLVAEPRKERTSPPPRGKGRPKAETPIIPNIMIARALAMHDMNTVKAAKALTQAGFPISQSTVWGRLDAGSCIPSEEIIEASRWEQARRLEQDLLIRESLTGPRKKLVGEFHCTTDQKSSGPSKNPNGKTQKARDVEIYLTRRRLQPPQLQPPKPEDAKTSPHSPDKIPPNSEIINTQKLINPIAVLRAKRSLISLNIQALWEKYLELKTAATKDEDNDPLKSAAEELLVEHYIKSKPYRQKMDVVVKKYTHFLDAGDLESEITQSLIVSIRKYKPTTTKPYHDSAFQAFFLSRRFTGATIDALRKNNKLGRGSNKIRMLIDKTEADLRAQLQREPTEDEVAEALGIDLADLLTEKVQTTVSVMPLERTSDQGEGNPDREIVLQAPDNPESLLEGSKEETIRDVYKRNKWNVEEDTAQGHLLKEGRLGAIRKFGGRLPQETFVATVPEQNGVRSPLTRWLEGEKVTYSSRLTPGQFYKQIKALFVNVYGLDEKLVESWIVACVFEDQGWGQVKTKDELQTLSPRERRLYEVRLLCARHPKHRGIITSVERLSWEQQVHLKDWLDGGEMKYKLSFTPSGFYQAMKSLLFNEYGMEDNLAEEFIVACVFEDQKWGQVKIKDELQTLSPREKRLYEVRLLCARDPRHRGVITSVYSLFEQRVHLKHWLDGKEMTYEGRFTPSGFYQAMKSLLVDEYGMTKKLAEEFIVASVFEDQKWGEVKANDKMQELSAGERLLYEVRLRCAQDPRHRGEIPLRTSLPGIKMLRKKSPFSAWLRGEHVLDDTVKQQVRLVLIHLYHQPTNEVDLLISAAA